MEHTHLPDVVDELVTAAHSARSGRAARTLLGESPYRLRQTVIAMTAGTVLSDHVTPGQATLQVLRGHVTLTADDLAWEGVDGDVVVVPHDRHGLRADQDSAILLTAVVG